MPLVIGVLEGSLHIVSRPVALVGGPGMTNAGLRRQINWFRPSIVAINENAARKNLRGRGLAPVKEGDVHVLLCDFRKVEAVRFHECRMQHEASRVVRGDGRSRRLRDGAICGHDNAHHALNLAAPVVSTTAILPPIRVAAASRRPSGGW